MKQQRFALLSILSLVLFILGCTSATPVADNSTGNSVPTTKTSQRSVGDHSNIANHTTQLSLETPNSSSDQFVNQMRRWIDNDNNFSVNAELVAVSLKKRSIKLLKENGVTIDVSIDRLSKHDRNFLTQAVHAMRDQLVNAN